MTRATAATPVAETGTVSAGRRFELLRTLGVGTFGTVYLAEMESSGGFRRRVALKLLNPTWDQASDASTRLRDEARLLGRLQHRHIVRVDDLMRLDGRWALLMEYVEGVDLECVVAPPAEVSLPKFSPRAALEVVQAVSAALWAASETPGADNRPLAVVHRDIKPSNIRVTPQGDLKVLDFGVARADFVGREARTERVRYGSIWYMSPERLLGGDETSAGDVYALGVVLFELVIGRSFGRCELAPAAQEAQVEAATEELREPAGSAAAELFKRMLAYEPEDRPSAREVEGLARTLVAGRTDETLAGWCAEALPRLRRDDGQEPDVSGRVLAESDVTGRSIVNSATMVISDDDLPSAPPGAGVVQARTESLAIEVDSDVPQVGGPKRMAWIVGGLTLLGLVAGIAWVITHPEEGGALPGSGRMAPPPEPLPVAAIAAPVEAPVETPAPVEAPPVASGTPAEPVLPPPPGGSGTPARRPAAAEAVIEAAPSEPAATEPVELLRSAKFVLAGSDERLDVSCGTVKAGGSGNALLNNFPAGTCTVRVGAATTSVSVQEPRKVECTLVEGTLSCR